MKTIRKVTLNLPADLLTKALESSGAGVTETVRQGLELVAASKAYEKLVKMKGKVRFDLDVKELRRDRK